MFVSHNMLSFSQLLIGIRVKIVGKEVYIGKVKAKTTREFVIEFYAILVILVNLGLGKSQVKLSQTEFQMPNMCQTRGTKMEITQLKFFF